MNTYNMYIVYVKKTVNILCTFMDFNLIIFNIQIDIKLNKDDLKINNISYVVRLDIV